ncbi:hypothetical protein KPL71_021787 [Citrus sinensis]|uniref:Uncharacterized protein n=1 Tax=Citrus sinensis TaxID=2711 RepID=A0ACB8JIA8_CITSI|nr:hypothetical protein KPL71_021787 [Citrus sinensis]
MEQQYPMVSYAQLSKATNNFSRSNLIGQGSFGSVYKGIFYENEMIVAVKVINLKQKGASRSFAAECDALRSIRHRNLIKIITICSSIDHNGDDFKALVYEYMESGSLEEWLHQSNDQLGNCTLSLIQRLNIAIDVASAIEYLHHHCQPPIVHGDLKPSNVLLDQDMVAHVGDFGLARILSDQPLGTAPRTESSSIGIKGTVGYVAPGNYFYFGATHNRRISCTTTLLAIIYNMFNDGLTLHEFAKMALPEGVIEIVEPSLSIGVLCSTESPAQRIEMTEVVSKLRDARDCFVRTTA